MIRQTQKILATRVKLRVNALEEKRAFGKTHEKRDEAPNVETMF